MAEIVKVLIKPKTREGQGFECQMCNWAWIPRMRNHKPAAPPRRCPNLQCRSRRWDREKYPEAGPPMPTPPNGGGGPGFEDSTAVSGGGQRTCYQTLSPSPRKPPVPAHQSERSPSDAIAA